MESEFMALLAAGKEAEWLRNLILEIQLWSKPIALTLIRYDSAAKLAKAYSQIYNGKFRHIGFAASRSYGLLALRTLKNWIWIHGLYSARSI
ncbi:hypothetical protein Tco_1527973 [Tanacetum coccineum]